MQCGHGMDNSYCCNIFQIKWEMFNLKQILSKYCMMRHTVPELLKPKMWYSMRPKAEWNTTSKVSVILVRYESSYNTWFITPKALHLLHSFITRNVAYFDEHLYSETLQS